MGNGTTNSKPPSDVSAYDLPGNQLPEAPTESLKITVCQSACQPKRNRYVKLKMLGYGTSGKVYQCLEVESGKKFAMKIIELAAKSKEEAIREVNNLKRQIGLLKKLSHPNIVGYFHFQVDDESRSVQIVLEKVTPGNLRDIVSKSPYSEVQASRMTKQILQGLSYLHQQGIIHRDLKGANILVNEDNVAKIADFGTAKLIFNKDSTCRDNIAVTSKSLKGTPYWMAPEVLRRTGHNFSADIWSVGCTVLEMLTGVPPWSLVSQNFQEIIRFVTTGMQPSFPQGLSKSCIHFLNCCLDTNPNNRLTAQELLAHKWIRQHQKGLTENSHHLTIEDIECNSPQKRNEQGSKKAYRKIKINQTPKVKASSKVVVSLASERPQTTSSQVIIQSTYARKQRQQQQHSRRLRETTKQQNRRRWEEELKAALSTAQ